MEKKKNDFTIRIVTGLSYAYPVIARGYYNKYSSAKRALAQFERFYGFVAVEIKVNGKWKTGVLF